MSANPRVRLPLGRPAQRPSGVRLVVVVRVGAAAVVAGAGDAITASVLGVHVGPGTRLEVVVIVVFVIVLGGWPVDGCILLVAGERVLGGFLDVVRRGLEVLVERRDDVLLVVPRSPARDSSRDNPQEPGPLECQ